MISISKLKQLREETGISMIECRKALEGAKDDVKRAKEILREKGKEMVKGREGRSASAGVIASYIHTNGKVGVLLEVHCETDFVAKNEEFKKMAHEICLQIAAANPLFIKTQDVPEDTLEREKKIYEKQLVDSGKPKEIIGRIIEGKLEKYKKENSLLSQIWIKDKTKTIKDLVDGYIAKMGENIELVKFARYQI